MPDTFGHEIDHGHADDDHQEDRADVGVVEFPDRHEQILAYSAGADHADHGARAHVDFKAQQGVALKRRHHLRQRAEPHDLGEAAARRTHALDRLHIDILERLGEKLAERAEAVDRDREDSRERSKTEGAHEHQGKDQIGDRAAKFEDPLDAPPQGGARRQIGGRKGRYQERAAGADQRAEIGDQDGVEKEFQPAVDVPVPVGNISTEMRDAELRHDAAEIAGEIRDVGDEVVEIDLTDPAGEQDQNSKDCKHQERLPAAAPDDALIVADKNLKARLRYDR